MAGYYVNKREQASGDHEVHREGCPYLPAASNRLYLGQFPSCAPAVQAARQFYAQPDGCYYCSPLCNNG